MKESWLEKLMFRSLPVWFVSVMAIFAFLGMVAFGNIAIHAYKGGTKAGKLGKVVLTASTLPKLVSSITASDAYLRIPGDFHAGKSGFSFHSAPGTRPEAGYLLLSRFDGDRGRSVVEYWDLDQQALLHTWLPPIDEINAASVDFHSQEIDLLKDRTQARTLIRHPFVTENGDLLIKSRTPMARLDACSRITWIDDDHLFHHAVEADAKGRVWTSSKFDPPTIQGVNDRNFYDDAVVAVDAKTGKVAFKRSIADVLISHGLTRLVFAGGRYHFDPIHLNDVQPVLKSGKFWKEGDLFLSLRQSSTILLYRPSTDEIVWFKQGPWSQQHDVDILDDHRISIFDNHSYPLYTTNRSDPGKGSKVDPFDDLRGHSDIAVYDFETDTVSYPWSDFLAALNMTSATEGLHTVRPNGDLFVEEQNRARLFEIDPQGEVLWEYVNRGSDGILYRTGWSRILKPDQGRRIASALAAAQCGQEQSKVIAHSLN
ncbi:MAG: arylsulfotransferase family protein [Marinibacterium sp.]